jgi:outer membrane protein OmpA-like peptidoglycan-associated protein
MRSTIAVACALAVPACTSAAHPVRLRRVVLYQNGIGYFERTGTMRGETLRLAFPRPELDDVLKTLTVIDKRGAGVATVAVAPARDGARTVELDVQLSGRRAHDLLIAYAVPTPTWKAAYRIVLDDAAKTPTALLQAWAMVNNVSEEPWTDVQLTLATGAPMSFSLDLHTPQFVARPDATGRMVTPTVLGPVEGERVGAGDRDGDGLVDASDRCPDSLEDRDQLDADDGCPEPDSDGDRLPDAHDACPNEPEVWNGHEDLDGCPDRGRVVVTSAEVAILDTIYFSRDSDRIPAQAEPLIDAIAATLRGKPDLVKIEIGGHADGRETEAWGLSARRAAAVRAALVARGIGADRLAIVPYGATRALADADTDVARDRNRRVEFLIRERAEDAARRAHAGGAVDARAARSSVRTRTTPHDVAGTVRYALTEPVTIPRGVSTMVSILNQPIAGEDAFLFRPDANAPGSDRHPFRAVRIENTSGFTLEPGPVAIFARGTFVGDGLVGRLHVGETAWIPYAIDSATTVTVETDEDEHPVRIVAVHRGVVTVENAGVRTTRYRIAAGREPAPRLFVRHDRALGYTAKGLPPEAQDLGEAYLVPVPVSAGKTSVLAVEERQPRRRELTLIDAGATELALYVEGGGLPPEIEAKLRVAVRLRKEMAAIEEAIEDLRTRIDDVGGRSEEIRDSIRALDRVRGADELRKKLVASLTRATTESDAIARELGARGEALAAARGRLQDAIRDVTLDGAVATTSPP